MSKGLITLLAALAALVLFVAINIVSTRSLPGARVDLTQARLYTLSEGSRKIASALQEPIRLTLYYSDEAAREAPQLSTYAQRVRETIQELSRASGGKIRFDVVNPQPFSKEQDQADQAGLIAPPTGNGQSLYFGLVGRNALDQQQVIPLFNPQNEQFLEYDLTRLIYLLSSPKKPVIGLMSQLPVEGTQGNPMMRRGTPPWQIIAQAKDFFDVKSVPADSTSIPADVQVLLIIHPKNLSERALYAIDQFVMRGGRLMVFVDPWCDADIPPGVDPMQAMGMPKNSDLKKLFESWGIEMIPEQIVTDRKNALRVTIGSQARPETISYVAWLGLGKDGLDQNDPITGVLQNVTIATPGALRKKDGATIEFTPLLTTSTDTMLKPVSEFQFIPDPKKLLSEFASGNQAYTLAARIRGNVKSAFPAGNPATPAAEGQPAPADPNHLSESKQPLEAIVVADCDMLSDRFWVQENRLGGIVLGMNKVADNGDLVLQSLDNLAGSSDLISVRARGRFSRPFERVQEIQRSAEQQFRAKEQELTRKVEETQQKIQELQRQRPEQGSALLTPEQKAEIEKFRTTLADSRKELRDVRFQMNKDVERLEQRLKIINIGLVPVLVGTFALGLAAYRSNRRRSMKAARG